MEKNKCENRYSPKVRDRAVWMVFEHQDEFDGQSIADLTPCNITLRENRYWVLCSALFYVTSNTRDAFALQRDACKNGLAAWSW